jgi:hypothetical protein
MRRRLDRHFLPPGINPRSVPGQCILEGWRLLLEESIFECRVIACNELVSLLKKELERNLLATKHIR